MANKEIGPIVTPYSFDAAFYQSIVEQTSGIILVVALDGRILFGNKTARTSYGYLPEELRSMNIRELNPPEMGADVDELLMKAQQEVLRFRTIHLRKNGQLFPVDVKSQFSYFSAGETGAGLILEITEIESLETGINQKEEKSYQINEEMAATEEELRHQVDELLAREAAINGQNIILKALHETALGMMQKPELSDVLRRIIHDATELIGTPHGYISLVDEEKGVFRRKVGLGYYAKDVGRHISLTEGIVGQVYQTGEMVIVDDYCTWENRLAGSFFDQLHCVAQIPLKTRNKVVGTFGLAFLTPGRKFTEQDLLFLGKFADLASIAVFNAKLWSSLVESEKKLQQNYEDITTSHEELVASEEELRQQFDELLVKEDTIHLQNTVLTVLHETAMGMMHKLDLEDVLKTIVASATQLLGTMDGFINLVNEEQGVFVRKVAVGRFAQDMNRQTKLDAGLLGQAYLTGEMVVKSHYNEWEQRFTGSLFENLECVVVVPLKDADKVVGGLTLAFSDPNRSLAKHELFLLQRFADLAAISLKNATLVTAYQKELHERKLREEALRISEANYRVIFEAANDGISIYDPENCKMIDLNEKICEMYGFTREEMLADNTTFGIGESPYSEHEAKEWFCRAATGEPQVFEWQKKCKDGKCIWVEVSLKQTVIENTKRIIAVIRDISERKSHQQAVWQLAYHDTLTGLCNRACLVEFLGHELEKACRGEATGAILFIDMDDLKMVNDTFGHHYGDEVIIQAGEEIFAEAGEGAMVARIGGDEFLVLFTEDMSKERVTQVAGKMVNRLCRDYEVGNSFVHLTASIGIARYPFDGDTVADIFKAADLALYVAKGSGKSTCCIYEPNMKKVAYENMELKRDLRKAVGCGELSLQYQPIVETVSQRIVGFEALARWHSRVHGAVSPARFIPIAEESNLIQEIGKWVVEEACRFVQKVNERGHNDLFVSVNVSPRQLTNDGFITIIAMMIQKSGIHPGQLVLEITESTLIDSLEKTICVLEKLRDLGVSLSLDDFGTGYSSLTHLRLLPLRTIKIDKSFIDQILTDEAQWPYIQSIINMAKTLGLSVVAEGVETIVQLERLTRCQCEYIQGYLFSKPLPEAEALGLADGNDVLSNVNINLSDNSFLVDVLDQVNVLNQARDIILIVDIDRKLLYANQAAAMAYGYENAELTTMRIDDLRAKETLIGMNEQIKLACDEGILFRTWHVRKNGERFPVEVGSKYVRLPGRSGIISIIRDITETQLKEKALQESENMYRLLSEKLTASEGQLQSLFQYMHDAFSLHEIICDERGVPVDYRYIYLNDAMANLLGRSKNQIIGRTVRELLPDIEDSWIENFGKVALTGEPMRIINYAEPLDRYFAVSAYSPERNRFATLAIDVTDQKKAELDLQEKEGMLRNSLEELTAVHEELQASDEELQAQYEQLQVVEENLQRSNEKLFLALELSQLGLWEYHHDKNLYEFGNDFYNIYGTSVAREGRFMEPEVYAREFLPPEDAWLVQRELGKAISAASEGYSNKIMHRIIRRDGEERTIVVLYKVLKDANGKIMKIIGANIDIT